MDYEIDLVQMNLELENRCKTANPYPLFMPFGRYQGKPFEKVPGGYLRAVLRFPDLDPLLRQAIEAEHSRRHPPGLNN